jgi:hypothetical protein
MREMNIQDNNFIKLITRLTLGCAHNKISVAKMQYKFFILILIIINCFKFYLPFLNPN